MCAASKGMVASSGRVHRSAISCCCGLQGSGCSSFGTYKNSKTQRHSSPGPAVEIRQPRSPEQFCPCTRKPCRGLSLFFSGTRLPQNCKSFLTHLMHASFGHCLCSADKPLLSQSAPLNVLKTSLSIETQCRSFYRNLGQELWILQQG